MKAPASQFYWNDWARDLEEHPLEIEGAWIRICSKLWYSETRGELRKTLDQWGRILRISPEDALRVLRYIKEEQIGTIPNDLTEPNGKITVICRRMVREEKIRESNRLRQRRHYDKQKYNTDITYPSSVLQSTSVLHTSKKNKKIFVETSHEFRLSALLLQLIQERDPKAKANLQSWAVHVDRLIRIDGRQPDEIEQVVRWCQNDDFWQANILSTSKLREKYTQLKLQMQRGPNHVGRRYLP